MTPDRDGFESETLRLRGLTFWEPWASAIVRPVPEGATAPHPKRIDNRSHAPGKLLGGLLVIRTGKTVDPDGLHWINSTYDYGWSRSDLLAPGLLVGVARVLGVITPESERARSRGSALGHPWYFGPHYGGKPNFGWTFIDVVTFNDPIAFTPKCGLGQWPLPEEIEKEVRKRWREGMKALMGRGMVAIEEGRRTKKEGER